MGPTNANDLTGRRLGAYALESLLGARGILAVYRARDLAQGRNVAVHVLYSDRATAPEQPLLFRAAVERLAGLRHAHIMPVLDIGEEHDWLYVVGPLAKESAADRLAREGQLAPVEAARLIAQCAWALYALHTAGIARLLVNANNILFDTGGLALLADTGVARGGATPSRHAPTTAGLPLGVFEAMSPKRPPPTPVDYQSDLYALSAVLYQLLTTMVPRGSVKRKDLTTIVTTAKLTMSSVNDALVWPELEDVVLRSLEDVPTKRYPDARAYAVALRRAIARYDDGGAEDAPISTLVRARRTAPPGLSPTSGAPDAPGAPARDSILQIHPSPEGQGREWIPWSPYASRPTSPPDPGPPSQPPASYGNTPPRRPTHSGRRPTQPPVFNPNDPLVRVFKTQPPAPLRRDGGQEPGYNARGPYAQPGGGGAEGEGGPAQPPPQRQTPLDDASARPLFESPPSDAPAHKESIESLIETLQRQEQASGGKRSRKRRRFGRPRASGRVLLASLLALAVVVFGGGAAVAIVNGSAATLGSPHLPSPTATTTTPATQTPVPPSPSPSPHAAAPTATKAAVITLPTLRGHQPTSARPVAIAVGGTAEHPLTVQAGARLSW